MPSTKLVDKKLKAAATLFVMAFAVSMTIFYAARGVAQSNASPIPSSGSCAMLLTLPLPYGFDVAANVSDAGVRGTFQTGYNLIGQLVFNSATSATFSGRVINATFNSSNSAFIDANGGAIDLNGMRVQITQMTNTAGFTGGYVFAFSGTYQNRPVAFSLVGVPANGGKTIMMVSTSEGTRGSPGIGPGSGICQV